MHVKRRTRGLEMNTKRKLVITYTTLKWRRYSKIEELDKPEVKRIP